MKAKFFTIKGKNDHVSIYMRFWDGQRIDQKAKTGLSVLYDNWSNATQQVRPRATAKDKDFVNGKLRALKSHVLESYNIEYNDGEHIGNDWLKKTVNSFFNRVNSTELDQIYFTDWIAKFIESAPSRHYKGRPLAIGTIKNYKTAFHKLLMFEKHRGAKLKHGQIDLAFHQDYVNFCRDVEHLSDNSIGTHIKQIKVFGRKLEMEGLPINPQFTHPDFVRLTNETKDVYLNDEEVDIVSNYDFGESLRLDNARDLFIIGLRTGLRVSDFLSLKEIDMKKGFIEVKTQKTGETVVIPLHHQITTILDKRNGALPHSISDQKFNEYIKEVCRIAGITQHVSGAKMNPETKRKESGTFRKYELISSHTCRRSFASNLYGKLPNMVIMGITGHRTEVQFLKYIKITKQEHAETLKKHWAKEQQEKGYTDVLRVAK
jgi:integrase